MPARKAKSIRAGLGRDDFISYTPISRLYAVQHEPVHVKIWL